MGPGVTHWAVGAGHSWAPGTLLSCLPVLILLLAPSKIIVESVVPHRDLYLTAAGGYDWCYFCHKRDLGRNLNIQQQCKANNPMRWEDLSYDEERFSNFQWCFGVGKPPTCTSDVLDLPDNTQWSVGDVAHPNFTHTNATVSCQEGFHREPPHEPQTITLECLITQKWHPSIPRDFSCVPSNISITMTDITAEVNKDGKETKDPKPVPSNMTDITGEVNEDTKETKDPKPDRTTGMSDGDKIALAVGCGVGVPLTLVFLVVIIWICHRHDRWRILLSKQQPSDRAVSPSDSDLHVVKTCPPRCTTSCLPNGCSPVCEAERKSLMSPEEDSLSSGRHGSPDGCSQGSTDTAWTQCSTDTHQTIPKVPVSALTSRGCQTSHTGTSPTDTASNQPNQKRCVEVTEIQQAARGDHSGQVIINGRAESCISSLTELETFDRGKILDDVVKVLDPVSEYGRERSWVALAKKIGLLEKDIKHISYKRRGDMVHGETHYILDIMIGRGQNIGHLVESLWECERRELITSILRYHQDCPYCSQFVTL